MNKRILRTLYPVIVIGCGIMLALTSALSSPMLLMKPDTGAAALYQASTPTPIPEAVSQAGSTDGIMLMGVVIVLIVLLPTLLRRSTWKK
jgi:hypothetical protein